MDLYHTTLAFLFVVFLLVLILQFLNRGEVRRVPQITARSSSRVVQPQSSTLPTLLPLHSSKSPAWWLFGHARQSFNACSNHAPSLVGSPAKRLKARNDKPLTPVLPWFGPPLSFFFSSSCGPQCRQEKLVYNDVALRRFIGVAFDPTYLHLLEFMSSGEPLPNNNWMIISEPFFSLTRSSPQDKSRSKRASE